MAAKVHDEQNGVVLGLVGHIAEHVQQQGSRGHGQRLKYLQHKVDEGGQEAGAVDSVAVIGIFGGVGHHAEHVAQHHAGAEAHDGIGHIVHGDAEAGVDGQEEGHDGTDGNEGEGNAAQGALVFGTLDQIADGEGANHADDGLQGLGVGVQQLISGVVGAEVHAEGLAAGDNAPAAVGDGDLDDRPVALQCPELGNEVGLLSLVRVNEYDLFGGSHCDNEERRCQDGEDNGRSLEALGAAAGGFHHAQSGKAEDCHGQEGASHTVAGQSAAGLGVAGQGGRHGGIGHVHHGVQQDQNEVHAQAPPGTGRLRPIGVGGKGQHVEHQHGDKGEHHPGAVAAPLGVGVVGQRAHHGIVQSVPELGDKHDRCHHGAVQQGHVGVEEHQVCADQGPAHITGEVAAAVSNFTPNV